MDLALRGDAVLEARSAGAGVSLFGVFMRTLRKELLSEEQRQQLKLVEFAASKIGTEVLKASSLDDLEDRLDWAAEQPEMNHLVALLVASLTQKTLKEAAEPSHPFADALREADMLGASMLLEQAMQYAAASADVLGQLATGHGIELLRDLARQPTGEPLSFLADPSVPVELARLFLTSVRGTAAFFALCHIVFSGRKTDPWLVRALAERVLDGQRANLRFLASIPGVQVPEGLIRASEKLDVAHLQARTEQAQHRLDAVVEQARVSGAVVFPADAEPGDD